MAQPELEMLRIEVERLRLGRADDQVRIADLERSLKLLWHEIHASGLKRALRQAEIKERERERRYAAIKRIAGHLAPGTPAQICRHLHRIFNGLVPAPENCISDVKSLRCAYGENGPSSDTIRRALIPSESATMSAANFANACAKTHAAENGLSNSTREVYPWEM